MSNLYFNSKSELLEYARKSIGVPLHEIDKGNRLKIGKGAIGIVMEEGFFGYSANNNAEADFANLGVELKVTPFKRTKRGISAKERLVCNIIDYMKEYKETFETSSFWKKNNTILLMTYEYLENVEKNNYSIEEVALFTFPLEDLLIIKNDWQNIITKIREGKAHELSESDTLYLGACTKGANSNSLRAQPNSNILAMQRAYSLKTTYLTHVLREYIFNEQKSENVIKNPDDLRENTFEELVVMKIKKYFGRSQKSLKDEFDINGNPKNLNEIIISRILGVNGKVSKTNEFEKANIIPKTIRVRKDGHIVESMSFPTFKFMDIINQDWEDSDLYECFTQTKFMFIVFKENEESELFLNNVMFWNMNQHDLDEVRKVWLKTKDIIKNGVHLELSNGRIVNNLPKKYESSVAHVRPHARDGNDTYPLPDGRKMTKQCFWLNNDYIQNQICS